MSLRKPATEKKPTAKKAKGANPKVPPITSDSLCGTLRQQALRHPDGVDKWCEEYTARRDAMLVGTPVAAMPEGT